MKALEVFKKFSSQPQLKKEEFNPYVNKLLNPTSLGYGHRTMALSQSLTSLEFRNPLKPQVVESSISIYHILRPTLSPLTQ
jgi:hypothetical protein